ncbi:hypothetical protein GCM10027346_41960 [Hymenobacter seoulensis]
MRYLFVLAFVLGAGSLPVVGQSTLHFTLLQPPPLRVDAGPDKSISQGAKVTLGGTQPAAGGSGTYTYAWTPTTGLDRADTANPVASPETTTRYELTVSDPSGCSKTDQVTITVNLVTAALTPADPLGLRLYPNPSHGQFTLASEQLAAPGPLLVEVYSLLGQRIYTETFKATGQKLQQPIQLPPQVQGLYLLRLTGRQVNQTFTLLVQ